MDAIFHPEGTADNVTVKATLDTRFPDIESARAFLGKCIGATFAISSIEQKDGTRTPPSPFTTSLLQQEASRKLHLSVSRTMSIAQKLYEEGHITYMRTDSTNLSSLALNTAEKYICGTFGEAYHKRRQYRTKAKGAQEAHQMADAKVCRTDIKVSSDRAPEKFSVQATRVLFDGFLKLYMESTDDVQDDEDEVILPDLKTGTVMHDRQISAECKFTPAPARYSEASLVKKLEELGIGRPSTYAPTISTLTKGRGYITIGDKEGEKADVTNLILKDGQIVQTVKTETFGAEKRRLLPQEIGMIVTDYLVDHFGKILDYGFTADVEKEFDQIAEGKEAWNSVIATFYAPFHENVEKTLNNREYSRVSRELGPDPKDGQMLVARYGQYGPYVQKGEGENRVYASLAPGQLIESITPEEASRLFELPRTVGQYNGIDIICTKGRFGPYLKYDGKNISLPRGTDPLSVDAETCINLIVASQNKPATAIIAEFGDGIQVINGNYGPYIKQNGSNYRIPKGTDAYKLTEDACREIIANGKPTGKKYRKR